MNPVRRYRVEEIRGRFLLCGGIIPSCMIKPGQVWAAADGSGLTVTVVRSDSAWTTYQWFGGNEVKTHTKLTFAFQCRYCLCLDNAELPEGLA